MNDSGLFQGLDQSEADSRIEDVAREEFVTKRELVRIRRDRGSDETQTALSLRVRVKAANSFIAFCNRRRLTYREGFDQLVAQIEKLED